MRLSALSGFAYNCVSNLVDSKRKKPYSMLYYVIESADWVIKWEGKYITESITKKKFLEAKTTTVCKGIRNQIIHFGSINAFPIEREFLRPHKSNKIVLTWYHVVPDDPQLKVKKEIAKYADVIHTSCTTTRKDLIEIGIPPEKIVVVPLGVDLSLFKKSSPEEKETIREKIGIPNDKFVIGSFQKDGVGWEEGLEPKLVKGPDIFLKAIERTSQEKNVFVLLTGPARGYVKRGLEELGVPYKHIFLENYLEIQEYYKALDLYLVTSRTEGGPKAIVESMASGVPIISTKVGMATDVINDGKNGFLCEIEDIKTLSEKAMKIIEDKNLANMLIENASKTVENYSWEKIAEEYFQNIYSNVVQSFKLYN